MPDPVIASFIFTVYGILRHIPVDKLLAMLI